MLVLKTLGTDYMSPRAGETYDMVISELPLQVEMKEGGGGMDKINPLNSALWLGEFLHPTSSYLNPAVLQQQTLTFLQLNLSIKTTHTGRKNGPGRPVIS